MGDILQDGAGSPAPASPVPETPASPSPILIHTASEVKLAVHEKQPSYLGSCFRKYFQQWQGVKGKTAPKGSPYRDILVTFSIALMGMLAVSASNFAWPAISEAGVVMLIGSFGASAVLLYAAPAAALAQPRNVVFGHTLSALMGVACRVLLIELPDWHSGEFFVAALAVSLAIAMMQLTGTVHPPGGATALIAVTGDASIKKLGFLYVLTPAMAGAAIMTAVALILNNLPGTGHVYPQYW